MAGTLRRLARTALYASVVSPLSWVLFALVGVVSGVESWILELEGEDD